MILVQAHAFHLFVHGFAEPSYLIRPARCDKSYKDEVARRLSNYFETETSSKKFFAASQERAMDGQSGWQAARFSSRGLGGDIIIVLYGEANKR